MIVRTKKKLSKMQKKENLQEKRNRSVNWQKDLEKLFLILNCLKVFWL